jgi:hypothetical protein
MWIGALARQFYHWWLLLIALVAGAAAARFRELIFLHEPLRSRLLPTRSGSWRKITPPTASRRQ